MVYVIDLKERKPGCTGHPVVRLNLELRKARNKDLVKIIANKDDIPRRALILILKRYGFELAEISEKDGEVQVLIRRVI